MNDLIILSHGEDYSHQRLNLWLRVMSMSKRRWLGEQGESDHFRSWNWLTVSWTAQDQQIRRWPRRTGLQLRRANEFCSEYVRLSRELTIFASASKPLMYTAKGSVARKDSLALYAEEITELYASVEETPAAVNSSLQHSGKIDAIMT